MLVSVRVCRCACPRYDKPDRPVHFIVGGAGCDEMGGKTVSATEADPHWQAAKNLADYGMGILTVENVRCVLGCVRRRRITVCAAWCGVCLPVCVCVCVCVCV